MRPDQHKRRKNAIYKKAHGIEITKHHKNDQAKTTAPSINPTIGVSKKEIVSEEDDEEDEKAIIAEHFSRRKIENNWEKYERDIDERKEGDDGTEKSDDDSAYLCELSLKTNFQLDAPSWREVAHIIHLPSNHSTSATPVNHSEGPHEALETLVLDGVLTDNGVPTEIIDGTPTEVINSVLNKTSNLEQKNMTCNEAKLLEDLDLTSHNVSSLKDKRGDQGGKSIQELEDDLDDLLSL